MRKYFFLMISLITATSMCYLGCSKASAEKLNNTPVNVEVFQVSSSNGENGISYSGTIVESELIPLSFSGVGTVTRVLVDEGDVVRKGQLIAELNDETYKNAYNMTLATLYQAEDAYKRLQPMYKNGNLPEIKMVEVETALQQAKAATAIAKKSMDDCKLYSPVSGVIGKRSIDPGMMAMSNLTSINIVKIEKVYARIPVSENEISAIKKGDKAHIKIAALNNTIMTGVVEEIGVLADPIAHAYKVKIAIANKDMQLKPGMICSVILNKPANTSLLYVPSHSVLVDEQGESFVYVANNNKAEKKYVKPGNLLRNGVEILEGLNVGDKVVMVGQQKLVDNSLIHIVNQ